VELRATAKVFAIVLVGGVLAGCSSSTISTPPGAGSPGATTPPGESRLTATGQAAVKAKGAVPAGQARSTEPALADPDPAVLYTFAPAEALQRKKFRSATASIEGLSADLNVLSAARAGKPRAEVAVYTFAPSQAANQRFQAQIVGQLVTEAAGTTSVKLRTIDGHLATVAGGKNPAVGYFVGRTAVVVLARPADTRKQGLAKASAVAYAYSRR
jgi:hypothetical protein